MLDKCLDVIVCVIRVIGDILSGIGVLTRYLEVASLISFLMYSIWMCITSGSRKK